uniref:Chloramphenicol resistance protein n=1 Tax=Escherichia coli TaxID=562 RepID=CML_ECOLX|nr:RecName: Full=Chloramphenicol resistance protein [Escherichia coli]AAA26079.1 chloramphenicol-resistance protein (cml) [Plasmid R26]prf//1205237A chloramphenicol resistance gene cml [Escherichia coli]
MSFTAYSDPCWPWSRGRPIARSARRHVAWVAGYLCVSRFGHDRCICRRGSFWPETRVQRVAGLQWSQLLLPVKCLNFWLYTLCYAAGMGSFFVFFSIAPGLMMGRPRCVSAWLQPAVRHSAIAMVFTARFMGSVIPKWGSPSVLRMGMGCLIAGAVLLAITEIWALHRVRLYCSNVASGIGVATAVSVPMALFEDSTMLLERSRQSTSAWACTARKHRNVDHFAVAAQRLGPCRVTVWTLATVVLGLSCVSRVKGSRGQGEHDAGRATNVGKYIKSQSLRECGKLSPNKCCSRPKTYAFRLG